MESHLDICLSAIFLFNLSGKGDIPKERREPISVTLSLWVECSLNAFNPSSKATDIGSLLSFGPGFVC